MDVPVEILPPFVAAASAFSTRTALDFSKYAFLRRELTSAVWRKSDQTFAKTRAPRGGGFAARHYPLVSGASPPFPAGASPELTPSGVPRVSMIDLVARNLRQ